MHEKLLTEFPFQGRKAWENILTGECEGLDYEKTLVWQTYEKIKVQPYYCAEDIEALEYLNHAPGSFPFARGRRRTGNSWEIRQDILIERIEDANRKVLSLTGNGVNAIGLVLQDELHPDAFKILLKDIHPAQTTLHWITQKDHAVLIDRLCRLFPDKRENMKGSVSMDPLACFNAGFKSRQQLEKELESAAQHIIQLSRELPAYRGIDVNGFHFAEAGGSSVQELAFSLSVAAEYLSFFTGHGITPIMAAQHIQLLLATGSNYFFEISKLRAARILWANLLKAYDEDAAHKAPAYIQSITLHRNKTLYDAPVNLLRMTTEAMAAILGGCDSLKVISYDLNKPGEMAERLARNIQIILREEAHFDKVADPGAGSYYIESLTDALAGHAWQLFLETQKRGGYIECLKEGFIRDEMAVVAANRTARTARGAEVLLGTNAYPDFNEILPSHAVRDDAEVKGVGPKVAEQQSAPYREAMPFEQLRMAVEKHPGGRPKAFMVTYGNPFMRRARAQFSCNFFAAAGYEVIDHPGFETPAQGVSEALRNKADIIVACSSDEEYALTVPEIFSQTDGRGIVVVAGVPDCMDDLKKKGIQDFIFAGADMIETLTRIHNKLGITL